MSALKSALKKRVRFDIPEEEQGLGDTCSAGDELNELRKKVARLQK